MMDYAAGIGVFKVAFVENSEKLDDETQEAAIGPKRRGEMAATMPGCIVKKGLSGFALGSRIKIGRWHWEAEAGLGR